VVVVVVVVVVVDVVDLVETIGMTRRYEGQGLPGERLMNEAGFTALAHERLDVYQRAIEFLALASSVLDGMPKGHSALSDQLRRAALSIPLNIAEGVGKSTRPDQRSFFHNARGSAMECAAVLDACRVLELARPDVIATAKEVLVRIVCMLSRLTR